MPPVSKIVVGRPTTDGPTEHVFAFGHSDDGPRLVAVLAARIRSLAQGGSDAARNAARCLEPRTPWRDRLQALESALHDVTACHDRHLFALWDADALASYQPENFDVERSSLLRSDLYRVVRQSALEGGWLLVRSARTPSTSLDELDLPRELGTVRDSDTALPEPAARFAPECQPLAAWLVENHVLGARDLNEIKDTVANADGHLVDLVYQELPGPVRDAAKVLSVLRAPQKRNGTYGPIAFAADSLSLSASSVPVSARGVLSECGLLQPTADVGEWRMPRVVRERLYHLAGVTLPELVAQRHRLEAEAGATTTTSVDADVEAHHHAVCSGDVELAKQTARYYGSELADVARQLSLDAQAASVPERRALFGRAAAIYQHIVDHFDPTDAYAWEYLGYNLALSDGRPTEVLSAYDKAHRARPRNPLYHGRLLGYRGQLGEDVVAEAIAGINEYAQEDPSRKPVSYFAKTVFDGLRRGGRRDLVDKIERRSADILRALAPNVLTDA